LPWPVGAQRSLRQRPVAVWVLGLALVHYPFVSVIRKDNGPDSPTNPPVLLWNRQVL